MRPQLLFVKMHQNYCQDYQSGLVHSRPRSAYDVLVWPLSAVWEQRVCSSKIAAGQISAQGSLREASYYKGLRQAAVWLRTCVRVTEQIAGVMFDEGSQMRRVPCTAAPRTVVTVELPLPAGLGVHVKLGLARTCRLGWHLRFRVFLG